jgi:two-component system chemotaxis response regulator CheY
MPDDTSKKDRRTHSRTELILKIDYPTAEDFLADYTHDMSDTGVFVATSKPFSIGEQLTFDISFPGLLAPIRARGEVRWLRSAEVETDDEPAGIGVTFIFSSPEEEAEWKRLLEQIKNPQPPAADAKEASPFRVLLADDSPTVREMFRYAVQKFHRGRLKGQRMLDLVEAEDGNAAWERLQEGVFDMAIIDYYMPVMDGAELIRLIRKEDRHGSLAIIVVSQGSEEVCEEVYSAGADLFIKKPVLLNQLLKSLELVMDLKQR